MNKRFKYVFYTIIYLLVVIGIIGALKHFTCYPYLK